MLLPATIFDIKTLSRGRIENRNNSRHSIQKEKFNIGSQALKNSLEVWIPGCISWNDPWWSADLIWEGAVHSPKIRNVMNRELALGHLGVNTLSWAHTHTHTWFWDQEWDREATEIPHNCVSIPWKPYLDTEFKAGSCLFQNYISTLAKIKNWTLEHCCTITSCLSGGNSERNIKTASTFVVLV